MYRDQVRAGESQTAIASETRIPLATIGYWARRSRDVAAPKATQKQGRRRAAMGRSKTGRNQGIVWALDGDVLVVRIPLRNFARLLAQKALEEI